MPYTKRIQCPRCGRAFTHCSDDSPPFVDGCCSFCWREPDLTDEEVEAEMYRKDDS